MKKLKLFKGIVFGVVAVLFALSLSACGGSESKVAATVNGQNIMEQQITDYIQQFRVSNGLENDEEWAQWMVDNGRDAESMRSNAIDYFIQILVMEEDAKSKGITVTDQEVDDQIAEIKSYYDYDEEEFNEQLDQIGYTLDSYKDYVRQSLIQEKLMEQVNSDMEIDDAEILSNANSYTSILNGAKEIQVIAVDSEDAAKDAKKKVEDGTDFVVVQQEMSTTTDLDGWDAMMGLDANITTALEKAQKGALLGPIVSDDEEQWYVIKVNDVLVLGEKGFENVDQIPAGLRTEFEETVKQSMETTNFDTYLQGLVDGAEKTINPMPEGLPYDVSTEGLTPATSLATESTDTTTTVDVEGDTAEVVEDTDTETTVVEPNGEVVQDNIDTTTVSDVPVDNSDTAAPVEPVVENVEVNSETVEPAAEPAEPAVQPAN